MGSLKASLIVAASGRDTHMVNTLRCALAQRHSQLEILVVDSVDNRSLIAEDFLARKQSRIHYSVLPKRTRLALYNHAMLHATGDVLIFINDHTSFGPHFVEQHVACYLEHTVGAVQGRVISSAPGASQLPVLSRTYHLKGHFNCYASGRVNRLGEHNFSVRREAAEQTGMFDEQMIDSAEWAGADYGLRCCRGGWQMRFEARAELVLHGRQAAMSERLSRQHRLSSQYAMVEALMVHRHLSPGMRFCHCLVQRWQGWRDIQQEQRAAWQAVAAETEVTRVRSSASSEELMHKVMTPQLH